jgi:uncharacterized protein
MSDYILEMLSDFRIVFLSIVIEALPFLLIGALVAAIIELFVSEKLIKRILPQNKILAMISVSFIGLIFPICECAIIPITRKLIKKGVPISVAIMFMLIVPIINPISITSTFFAFYGRPEYVLYRIVIGFIVAFIVSLSFFKQEKDMVLKETDSTVNDSPEVNSNCEICQLDHSHKEHHKNNLMDKLIQIIKHTKSELISVGAFLIIGALVSSVIQVIIPDSFIEIINKTEVVSILSLQGLAYSISLCSHADAFVGASLINDFSLYPILAFLITSPLIDLKNTIVLFGSFKKKFSRKLIILVFVVIFVIVYIMSKVGI